MRSIPVLLSAALSVLAVTPTFAEQTWLVEDGTATLSLREGTLRSFGFEVVSARPTATPSAVTESALEPPLRSFGVQPGARFVTDNGGFQAIDAQSPLVFGGGIALRTFDPASGNALTPVLVYDFEIAPAPAGERLLELRSLSSPGSRQARPDPGVGRFAGCSKLRGSSSVPSWCLFRFSKRTCSKTLHGSWPSRRSSGCAKSAT